MNPDDLLPTTQLGTGAPESAERFQSYEGAHSCQDHQAGGPTKMKRTALEEDLQTDLELLLYLILRDGAGAGSLEAAVCQVEDARADGLVPKYSNKYVAGYARELTARVLFLKARPERTEDERHRLASDDAARDR